MVDTGTAATPTAEEFTVDELAKRAGMTVRNVRAYSTRGLIDPPRLEGRTGYYSAQHLQRLMLIRTLLNRGFTLAAVEEAILNSPSTAPGVALDLINIFGTDDEDPSELIARDELADLAGVERHHPVLDRLIEMELLEVIDDDTIRMTNAGVVRSGAMAMSLGLTPDSIAAIVPVLREHLGVISDRFVEHTSADITQPFLDAGMPEEEWPRVLSSIDALIPIASQVVASMFRATLREAIEVEVGHKLEELAAKATESTPANPPA